MFKDMALLNAGETTLNEIGTKYGLTREAIRLIYNKVFDEKYTVTVKRRVAKNKEDRKRAVEEWNKWGNRIKRASESGKNKHGFKTEVIFEEKCRSLNYDVVMHGAMAPIDSTVNGFLVDVKTGTLTEVTPGEFYFRFNVSKAQAIGVDFFAAYIKKDDAWYIIPNDKTKSKKYTAYITPKFRQYLNTWDQLELSNSFPQSKNSS